MIPVVMETQAEREALFWSGYELLKAREETVLPGKKFEPIELRRIEPMLDMIA